MSYREKFEELDEQMRKERLKHPQAVAKIFKLFDEADSKIENYSRTAETLLALLITIFVGGSVCLGYYLLF